MKLTDDDLRELISTHKNYGSDEHIELHIHNSKYLIDWMEGRSDEK